MNGQAVTVAVNTLPFWSRFTQTADLRYDGTNLFRTIVPAGTKIPVFDYRKGENNVTALEGSRATARDTLLVNASQTRGGGLYRIRGLSITKDGWAYERSGTGTKNGTIHTKFPPFSLQPANAGAGPQVMTVEDWRSLDSLMAHNFLDVFRVELNIDGSKRILEMGPAQIYPGVGGASGSNVDTTNGGTFVANYMHIPEGIEWNPAGAVDSNIIVNLEATYDLVLPTWTAPNGETPDGDPIAGAIPTAIGREWTQGWIVNFHGQDESPTSDVS